MTTDEARGGPGSGVTARWASPAYADRVRAFVTDAVGEPSALREVRRRPWSTVWRAETDQGVFYAKENCPGQAAEVATLTTIAAAVPGRTVPVMATDPDDTDRTGLFLTADHGPTLAQARHQEVTTADWCRLVTDAAALARDLLPARAALALTELDPHDAAAHVVTLADELATLPEGDPCRLDATDRHRIEVGLAGLADDVAQVGALGLPLVFDHNDLHADNVFTAPGPTGGWSSSTWVTP